METVSYLDFELKVVGQSGQYAVQVLRSPEGEARCELQLSLSDAELENLLLKLTRVRSATRRVDPPELAAARQLGTELFRATFRDSVRDCFRSSAAAAQRDGHGLRLKLRLQDAPELAVLPWEFLYDPQAERFLAQSVYTPIVRYVELPESIPAFKTARPLRLLGIVASPYDYDGIDVPTERKLLERALAPVVQSGQLEISWLDKPTLGRLQRTLRNDSYHILHFVGHGGFHEPSQQGVLVFEDERAHGAPVKAEKLGVLLHDHHPLRLAVLNSCEGARNANNDPFAGVATTLVRQGIPAVVAMQFIITDRAALAFAEEFYSAVADGFPVDTAVAEARKAILSTPNEVEWGTPVLFTRTANGVLFDFHVKAPGQRGATTGTSTRQEKSTAQSPRFAVHEDASPASETMGSDARLAALWRSALTSFYSRNWLAAIKDFQTILEMDPTYKDAATKLAKAQREVKLARLYAEARQACDAGCWQEAAEALQQVIAEDKSYKDAVAMLFEVRKAMTLAARYDDAQTLASAGQWHAVLKVLSEIAAIDPEFPDPEQLQAAAQAEVSEQARLQELDALLSRALECFEAEDWKAALLHLTRIQATEPDYMGSTQLLLRVEEELAALQQRTGHAQVLETGTKTGKLKEIVSTSISSALLFKPEHYLGVVYSVAFSPDGKLIATGSYDKTVRLWDTATGAALHTFKGHDGPVYSIAFSPDGKLIASGSDDRTVRLWDAATGAPLRTLKGHDRGINSVTFSPDGKAIASGSWDKTVRLWDAATGAPLRTLKGHRGWVFPVAFNADGNVIVSGSEDTTMRLWDPATGAAICTLTGHNRGVNTVVFSPDGAVIASGSSDSTMRLWDAATGVALRTIEGHVNSIYSVAFSPDGIVIVSGGYDKTVRLWDAASGSALLTLQGHGGPVRAVVFSPDGNVIATASNDETVRLWSIKM